MAFGSTSLATELLTVLLVIGLNAVIVYIGYKVYKAFQ